MSQSTKFIILMSISFVSLFILCTSNGGGKNTTDSQAIRIILFFLITVVCTAIHIILLLSRFTSGMFSNEKIASTKIYFSALFLFIICIVLHVNNVYSITNMFNFEFEYNAYYSFAEFILLLICLLTFIKSLRKVIVNPPKAVIHRPYMENQSTKEVCPACQYPDIENKEECPDCGLRLV